MVRKSQKKSPDNDPTDELPILSEELIVAAGGEIPELGDEPLEDDRLEDTGTYKLEIRAVEPVDATPGPASETTPTAQAQTIQALERDVAELSARWNKLEEYFADHEGTVGALKEDLAAANKQLDAVQAERQRLEALLKDKDSELASLATSLEDERGNAERARTTLTEARAKAAELDAAVETAQTELETARTELEAARHELKTAKQELNASLERAAQAKTGDEQLKPYLEEVESLKAYIAGRRSRWDEMEGIVAAQSERIAELETEMNQRIARQTQLEQMLHTESDRADGLKSKVVELSSALEERDRDLDRLSVEAGLTKAATPSAHEGEDAVPVSVDPTGKLRVSRLQSRLADQRALLGERERQLAAANQDREHLSGRLASTEEDLGQTRNNLKRLEKKLMDREYSVEAQDQRIATLQMELAERLTTLRDLQQTTSVANEDEVVAPANTDDEADEAATIDTPAAVDEPPVLVCLTSDRPERHVLDKAEIKIGRSSSCDIQILTHFVSREHAGIVVEDGNAIIEDRGSTNGVFVNSVRVERQALKHGDWVTIGETQFRYLAHEST